MIRQAFQSLVGTLKTDWMDDKQIIVNGVSIPRRYAKNGALQRQVIHTVHSFNPS